MRAAFLIVPLALTSSACYQYFPVAQNAPLPEEGAEVRVHLASPQELDLGTMTIDEVRTVEGYVREAESDSLSLFSSELRTYYGYTQRTNGAVFYFDRSQFGLLEERRIVPWKTAAAIGTATVGIGAVMYFAIELGGGSENDQIPNNPDLGITANLPISKLLPLLFP